MDLPYGACWQFLSVKASTLCLPYQRPRVSGCFGLAHFGAILGLVFSGYGPGFKV